MAIPTDREPLGFIIEHGVIAPSLVVDVASVRAVAVAVVAADTKGVGGEEGSTGFGVMPQLLAPFLAHPLERGALQWASPFHA